jgi:hypothetical protein
MDRIDHWRDQFEDAIVRIQRYRTDVNPEMRRITCWLMETTANPYSFLQWGYARAFQSADQFAALLQTIHHALVDDGEITFVAVNGRPMIVFVARDEIGNVELRTDIERELADRRGEPVRYEFLEGLEAFIECQERRDAYIEASTALRAAMRAGEFPQEEYRQRAIDLKNAYDQPRIVPAA